MYLYSKFYVNSFLKDWRGRILWHSLCGGLICNVNRKSDGFHAEIFFGVNLFCGIVND